MAVEGRYAPISVRAHACLDAIFVVIGLAAPWALRYGDHRLATLVTLALVAFGLGLNLVTAYPGGLWKRLPFRWHRTIEWTAPVPFAGLPWLLFPEAGAAPWFLSALGIAILLNSVLTSPNRA